MKKKLLAVLISTAMLAGILGGCGSSPAKEKDTGNQSSQESQEVQEAPADTDSGQETASGTESTGDKKKIVLWTWATGQFDAVIDAYFEAHPDADWELEEVVVAAEDYLTKLQQGYASGGDMPDLLMAEMGWRGSAFALDVWENLEEAPYNFDRSIVMDSVIGGMVNSQDQVIGIENGLNPAFMMYKKDLAREYLGTDDRAELEAMFKSYDDYAAKGTEIYEKSGGAVTLFPGLQDISNMIMMQQRNVSNVNAGGDVDVSGKAKKVFDTVEAMRSSKACGNLAQYSTRMNGLFSG